METLGQIIIAPKILCLSIHAHHHHLSILLLLLKLLSSIILSIAHILISLGCIKATICLITSLKHGALIILIIRRLRLDLL
jgi:hypothetical protein